MSHYDFSFTLLLENGASCCSVSDRGENSFGILKMCQSSGGALSRVGGRLGYHTPGCVQVLVSGAEDLARIACSTFPHTKMKHGSEFFTKRPKFLSSLRRNSGILKKIPDCFGTFRNSSVCFGCFDIGSKHRNKPKKKFVGFTKQTETNAKQILFRFVSVRTEIFFLSFRGHPSTT